MSDLHRDFEEMFDRLLATKPTDVPDRCPYTGLRFFDVIKDEDGVPVPVYGGPFDSYTIPVTNDGDDYWTREHYDWDAGWWSESECVDVDGIDEEE